DRDLLLAATHLTIAGMILAGLVVGASKGWIYIRHEYPEQAQALRDEIERAKNERALGDNIFRSGKRFELEVFVSPGNYICGEQTALIEAMEDKRAEPRIRPPQLSTNGYKDQPTVLNNVETFAWIPAIMLRETGEWYAVQGRKTGPLVGRSSPLMKGQRFFSVSGDVCRPGAYEVPTGIPLGELISEYCGGMLPGKELVAVALSGPSNGLLPARIPVNLLKKDFAKYYPTGGQELDVLDIPLDINVARELGILIGAGIVIYGSGCDLLAEALSLSAFFRNESCGKCVPCRIGSQKITQIGFDIFDGKVRPEELPTLKANVSTLSEIMKVTSICGLGQVAHQPMQSVVRYFPELLDKACQSTRQATRQAE
ncbi:MAG: SLBB domain-containing protein, partial [Pirellulaceae bacterium]|nr:SLBB domain-containing protein [Pirellulaceae bacterium]